MLETKEEIKNILQRVINKQKKNSLGYKRILQNGNGSQIEKKFGEMEFAITNQINLLKKIIKYL